MRLYLLEKAIILGCVALFSSALNAEEYTIGQKNKTFVKDDKLIEEITVNVGDEIRFENMDPWFHNVFSLSDIKSFDLGSYPKGESKSVKFDKAGTVEIECAIHPSMFLKVQVK